MSDDLPAGFTLDSHTGSDQLPAGFTVDAPAKGGIGRNLNAGVGTGLTTILGAPADIVNYAAHHNPVSMALNAGSRALGYGDIDPMEAEAEARQPKVPIGGSEWLKQKAAGNLSDIWDPATTSANTGSERVARAAGETLPMALVPVAGETSLARNFATMAGVGAGTQLTEEALPEGTPQGVRQALDVLGGIATGAGTNALARTPRMFAEAAAPYVRPFTPAGRRQLAADTIRGRASNPAELEEALAQPSEIVTGSKPTTFQQTGDMGLGSLERESAARQPAQYMQRRAEQNAARVGAVGDIQEGADPVDTANFFHNQVNALDTQSQNQLDDLIATAHAKTEALGGTQNPEEYGANLREALQTAETGARTRERTLWKAVDPDNSLVMNTVPVRNAADEILGGMSSSAKPMTGEEAAIFDRLGSYQDQMPFQDVADLRSRVSAAMREELTTNGASPTYARLTRLRGAIQDNLSNAVLDEASQGTVTAPANSLASKLTRWRDEFYANAQPQARALGEGDAGISAGRLETASAGEAGAGQPTGGRPRVVESGEGVSPSIPQPFDQAANERLAQATNATKERAQTFGAPPVKSTLAKAGTQDAYRLPEAKVPDKFFHPGPGAFQDIQALRKAVGDDSALTITQDYAASSLRKAAERPDGTLDPKKVTAWQAKHADAMRAFPELGEKFADAATASKTIDAAAAARADMLKDIRSSAIGRIMEASEPQDVQNAIGSIFGKQNAVATMKNVAAQARKDPDAWLGLRQAVVNHIKQNFIGNTEAGTSGASLLKSDQFQTFLKKNEGTLAAVFEPEEIQTLKNIGADLQRANRSITAIKLPGGSNTAQDLFSLYANSGKASVLDRALAEEGGAIAGTVLSHGAASGGILGWLGAKVVIAARNAGIKTTTDLIDQAMLHPDLARELLRRDPMSATGKTASDISAMLRRIAATSAAETLYRDSK
jgi:hypothetical protein